MDSRLTWLTSEKEIPKTFMRFYAVGLLLFMIPLTRELFISITALSLLLVFVFVFRFHNHWNVKTIVYFAFIVVSSFLLEMQGTLTGEIFGEYYYQKGLGVQINHTPLIIGLNWLFLVYASHDLAHRLTSNVLIRIITGALLMVCYDLLLEWVAPYMRMWSFDTAYPPFRNFAVWFITSLVYHAGLEVFRIRTDNKPAGALFIIQAGFFLILGIYSSLFIK